MERRHNMSERKDRYKKLIYPLLAIVIIMLAVAGVSSAGSKTLGVAGETGYTLVKMIEPNYLTSEAGRFHVLDTTKILDQKALQIRLSDIKKDFLVDIRYVRIGGELTALEIVAKLELKKEDLPK